MTELKESTFVFQCEGSELVGVLHEAKSSLNVGVVVIVGGPQYRVGSHRQFVLLARELAGHGVPTMRFDYRGMGDSEGDLRGFEFIAPDIRAAVDEFVRRAPHIKRVVLWGLCDGATAASFYASTDPRIAGLVLLNPWIRSSQTLAKSLLTDYYGRRLFDFAAWRRVLTNPRLLFRSAGSAVRLLGATAGLRVNAQTELSGAGSQPPSSRVSSSQVNSDPDHRSLADRMATQLQSFENPILLVLSGSDITANEFVSGLNSHRKLRTRLQAANVTRRDLFEADHTFSRAMWRNAVAAWTSEWLTSTYRERQSR